MIKNTDKIKWLLNQYLAAILFIKPLINRYFYGGIP